MGYRVVFTAQTRFILLPLCMFLFSGAAVYAENPQPELLSSTQSLPQQYIQTLETAISDYEKIVANGGWPAFPLGKTIKPGMSDKRIPAVRQILSIMGDYRETHSEEAEDLEKPQEDTQEDETTKDSAPSMLDDELAGAVKQFQSRHGLEADGAIGKKTQAELAVNAGFRLSQLQATLERMQKMPELEGRYILVNIPGFYLQAVDGNEAVFTSRIIVGTPKDATPMFQRPITNVSFNPAWHVPARIARDELMAKLRTNPDYFIKGNYVIKDRNGEIVNTANIDWENQSGHYSFTQRPGNENALGKIKFSLPDTGNIYLHSTSAPKLFNNPDRALSHGCIRVEMARDLAYFVMDGLEGWDTGRIDKLYDSDTTKTINVTPVPVYIAYWTSWVDAKSGQVNFRNDVYGHDKKRISEITAGPGKGKSEDKTATAM